MGSRWILRAWCTPDYVRSAFSMHVYVRSAFSMHVYAYVCTCMYVYVRVCTCMYVYVRVCTCTDVFLKAYFCVRVAMSFVLYLCKDMVESDTPCVFTRCGCKQTCRSVICTATCIASHQASSLCR